MVSLFHNQVMGKIKAGELDWWIIYWSHGKRERKKRTGSRMKCYWRTALKQREGIEKNRSQFSWKLIFEKRLEWESEQKRRRSFFLLHWWKASLQNKVDKSCEATTSITFTRPSFKCTFGSPTGSDPLGLTVKLTFATTCWPCLGARSSMKNFGWRHSHTDRELHLLRNLVANLQLNRQWWILESANK